MRIRIRPFAPRGTAIAPPSKSMAHRLLLCAGLCEGETLVQGVELSEDVSATLDCLRALSADCVCEAGNVLVRSGGLRCGAGETLLPCRESGSTLRFFIPLCLQGPPVCLTGTAKLLSRPLGAYEAICAAQGIGFRREGERLFLQGSLAPGEFVLPGDVSSQFVSGLLFALPRLAGESRIRLEGPVESRSYIDMTLDALRCFGVRAAWENERELAVPGGQRYALPAAAQGCVRVEGDWSNAAFFLALGLPVEGLREDSLQGDRVCGAYFRALDEGPAELDLRDCPDLAPVLMAYAALRQGALLTGTRRLRLKESDRGAAMQAELRKFGVPVEIEEDRIRVGCGPKAPSETLCGHNDHRIVMALSVLCARTGGVIDGAEAVRKSFPAYFERLAALGAAIEELPEEPAAAVERGRQE